MRSRRGCGAIVGVALLATLATVGYTAYASTAVYRQLGRGRQELVAAQANLTVAARSADPARLQACAAQFRQAERNFSDAGERLRDDPALHLAGGVPAAAYQLDATRHLAGIGADMSRAGEAAAIVASQVAGLKQKYAAKTLLPDDLQLLLLQAQIIARDYSASTRAIGEQLLAAHGERSLVTTTELVAPLRNAYDEVDRALAEADSAFLRYQDVRQVLSDFLGVRLPA